MRTSILLKKKGLGLECIIFTSRLRKNKLGELEFSKLNDINSCKRKPKEKSLE